MYIYLQRLNPIYKTFDFSFQTSENNHPEIQSAMKEELN